MALVLLCQLAHWGCPRNGDPLLFSGTCSFKARQGVMAGEGPSNRSIGHFHNHGGDFLLPACTRIGWRDQILERLIGHWDAYRLRLLLIVFGIVEWCIGDRAVLQGALFGRREIFVNCLYISL